MADGTHLPVGALVGADTNYNVFKHSTLENPDVFDGFRFERLRDQENSDSKYQVGSDYHVDLFFPHMPLANEDTSFLGRPLARVMIILFLAWAPKLALDASSPSTKLRWSWHASLNTTISSCRTTPLDTRCVKLRVC